MAAYIISEMHNNVFDVPPTAFVTFDHPYFKKKNYNEEFIKEGALQKFVKNDGISEDYGNKMFPVHEV